MAMSGEGDDDDISLHEIEAEELQQTGRLDKEFQYMMDTLPLNFLIPGRNYFEPLDNSPKKMMNRLRLGLLG